LVVETNEEEANKRLQQERLNNEANRQSSSSPAKSAHDVVKQDELKTHLLADEA
jgi:hypothetical protein